MGLSFTLDEPVEGAGDLEKIPDNTLVVATLMGTTVKRKTYRDEPEPVDRLLWKFRIDEGPYFDRLVWGETGVKLTNHPNCKLLTWSRAVLGFDYPIGYQFEESDLWNRKCRILIGLRDGTNKAGEPTQYNYIEEVLSATAAPATAGAPGAIDEEPF